MLPVTLFYSWQMDRPTHVCRDFIRKSLDEAVAILKTSGEIALTIDSDTQGEPEHAADHRHHPEENPVLRHLLG